MGGINELIALGIDVALGEDGYYHELRKDGTLGSIVYADFIYTTSIFTSHCIEEMIELGSFNFKLSETDQELQTALNLYGRDNLLEELKKKWGDTYELNYDFYKVDEFLAGIYHGTGEDLTEEMRSYLSKKIPYSAETPELEGCVAVDARLAEILDMLMTKFVFENVDHSWTKLCYYYDHLGSASN